MNEQSSIGYILGQIFGLYFIIYPILYFGYNYIAEVMQFTQIPGFWVGMLGFYILRLFVVVIRRIK